MHTHLRRLKFTIATLLVASHSSLFAENILLNPGIETGTSSDWPGISIESTEVHSGSYAACLDQLSWWHQSYQTVTCDAGEFVSFGGYLKSTDILQNTAGIRLHFLDADGQTIETHNAASISGTTPYTYYAVDGLLAPEDTVSAKMDLYIATSTTEQYGTVYFDDLFIDTFSHKAVSLLDNGNFENDYTNWTQGHASLVTGSNAYEGDYASAITHSSYWKQSWYQLSCTPLQEYAVSFAFATDSATSTGLVQLRYYDVNGDYISTDSLLSLSGTNPYTLYYTDGIYPPSEANEMRLLFAAAQPGTGTSYLDDVIISTDAQGLASTTLIPQSGTELLSNTDFEIDNSNWTGGVQIETSNVGAGLQSGKMSGVGYYKWYTYDLVPAVEGQYYSFSALLAAEDLVTTPAITLCFYDADDTLLSTSDNLADLEGTSPYREFRLENLLAPEGTTQLRPRIGMPSNNLTDSALYVDEIHVYELETLPVYAVSTYESIGVYIAQQTPETDEVAHVYYRVAGETEWNETFDPIYDSERGEYRVSIANVNEGSTYEVQAVIEVDETVLAEAGTTITTWSSTPTIGQTLTVASLYTSGQLLIENMHGSSDAWIKIVGTGDSDIDGAYADDAALLIQNSSYLIFENIEVKGGRLHGVEIYKSEDIRILNCEISGWARQPNYTNDGLFYETESDMTNDYAINQDAAVYLNESSQVTIERCYMHDPRLSSNSWKNGHPEGPNALLAESDSNSGNNVVRYNDMIGSDELRWNDAIEGKDNSSLYGSFHRDSDIYGNMLAFGNDDGIELDGGQMNLRFFGNRVENFYTGISLAPNRAGPSYLYRNVVLNLGDMLDSEWAMVKNGGGTTYSQGKCFLFNNTMYSEGNGLAGVGFGSDTDRSMFLAMSRNNIFYSLSTSDNYSKAISDSSPNDWNSFDYDNLASADRSSALVDYSEDQEANGILDDFPVFIDATNGDMRLASDSSGIDAGIAIVNFVDTYASTAPDQGALEDGSSSLIPIRPIAISADKYIVALSGTADGSTTPVTVTLTMEDLDESLSYEILMNNTVDWVSVSPTTGTLNSNSTQTLTLTLLTAGLSSGETLKATILVKLANGYSVPITVNAEVL
jgi:hypothetical protein